MKFVLKIFVLGCLIVMSKLAKDEAIALENPVAKTRETKANLTKSIERSPIAEREVIPVSVKFEKTALQLN